MGLGKYILHANGGWFKFPPAPIMKTVAHRGDGGVSVSGRSPRPISAIFDGRFAGGELRMSAKARSVVRRAGMKKNVRP
jgi:hypothetical protein